MSESRVARVVQATGRLCETVGAMTMLSLALLVVVGVVLRMSGVAMSGRSEISQLLIVVVAASSLVVATALNGHASVHLVVDRLSHGTRRVLAMFAAALGLVYWGVVAFANLKLLIDNTRDIERTELLHVPVWPFRGFWVASLTLVCCILVARVIWPGVGTPQDATHPDKK